MPGARLRWSPSPAAARLATIGSVAAVVALVLGRATLWMFAVVPLALLVAAPRRGRPTTAQVDSALDPDRCVEGDEVTAKVTVAATLPVGALGLTVRPGRAVPLTAGVPVTCLQTASMTAAFAMRGGRWGGSAAGTLQILMRDLSGNWQAHADCALSELRIYPRPAALRHPVLPRELPPRIGNHPGRAAGSGAEFFGIRRYIPGDPLRQINWPVSTRLGSWYVTQRVAERSADIVVGIDVFSDVGGTLDRSVHGATTVCLGALDAADRVGVVVFGGALRWFTPSEKSTARYRIPEMMIDLHRDSSVVTPDIDRVPRAALPPGAVMVAFTPLLDPRAVGLIVDLARRRVQTVVVDVLMGEPPDRSPGRHEDPERANTLLLWRMDRAALLIRLSEQGAVVLHWDGVEPLDRILAPALRRIPVARSW